LPLPIVGIPRPLRRRDFLAGAIGTTILPTLRALAQEQQPKPVAPPEQVPKNVQPFSFDKVRELARKRASRAYEAPKEGLPEYLDKIGYDQYRDIRYRPEQALWHGEGLPFEVQFFHRGFLYKPRIDIAVVNQGEVKPVIFSPTQFHYGNSAFPIAIPPDLGYAGLRLHYSLNRPDYKDEVAAFLGASYFRVLGAGQVYGASARGLAINTVQPSGEEFPMFRSFWLERPAQGAAYIRFWALLDSPSLAGAYQFVLQPGAATTMDIDCTLYTRNKVQKLELAPLTSMFFNGETGRPKFVDYRPEVHDSDGLLAAPSAQEWRWRPLKNPEKLQITSLPVMNPHGYGLLQRDRTFADYQDLESRFELRPSLWVKPKGEWGEGAIELIEIPSNSEANDNIVVGFIPAKPIDAGQEVARSYTLRAFLDEDQLPPLGRAVATRLSLRNPGHENAVRMVVDFNGGALPTLPNDAALTAEAAVNPGRLLHVNLQRNAISGGWRVSFLFEPQSGDPIELHLFLRKEEQILTETWTWRWPP
jgi:periplasmic glucans biosynthesis protein